MAKPQQADCHLLMAPVHKIAPVKILHLEASAGWGGQEIRILKEAEGMRHRGHEVFFGVMRGAALARHARAAGFTVYELNFKRHGWIGCAISLFQILRRHQIEILNTHSSLDSWIGGIVGRWFRNLRILRTRHLSTPVKAGFNSRFVYGKLADFVVTTCHQIIDLIALQSGKPKQLFRCVATGVNPNQIQVTDREVLDFKQKIGWKENDFLVGMACFMRSWKGIEAFLEAADRLRSVPDLKWVLIGGGHAEKYKDLARKLQLGSTVIFTDHLENPFPAIRALDVFALLSTAHEGISQAMLQAAYLERPLISTPTGGLGEICLNELTGIVVPPFSSQAVVEAVIRLKNDSALRARFGEEGKKLVLRKFTFDQTLDEMETIYYHLLQEKKHAKSQR
jgi:glycosyltransferase involved in cell wall biosynthesis